MSRPQWFKPLTRKVKTRRLIAIDTEDDSRGNLVYGVIRHEGGFVEAESAKEMRRLLKSRRWRGCLCCCVNMEYDLSSIFGREWKGLHAVFTKGAGMVIASLLLRKRRVDGRQMNEYLEFTDLRNLDRSASVARLGTLIGLEKLEDVGKSVKGRPRRSLSAKEWESLKTYCKRDAEITYKAGAVLQDEFNRLGGDMGCTIGRVAMTIWRRRYQKLSYTRMSPERIEFLHRCYYGGRTEAFRVGLIRPKAGEHLYYADVNSMYPWAMATLHLPHPDTFRYKRRMDRKLVETMEGMTNATVSVRPGMRYPPLPVLTLDWKERHEEGRLQCDLLPDGVKLVFPTGTFSGWWTNNELRYALSLEGVRVVRYGEGCIFKTTGPYLRDFVRTVYRMRKKAKTKIENTVLKLVLNSLYGKFAQRGVKVELISIYDYKPKDDWSEDATLVPERNPRFVLLTKEARAPIHTNIIWSAMVTAAARVLLHQILVKYEGVYCDTDSIITEHPLKSSRELGKLKVEKLIEELEIVAPKHYRLKTPESGWETVCKGIPKRLQGEAFGKKGGRVEVSFDRPRRLREALRRGLQVNEWHRVTKVISRYYDKRILLPDGDTRPIQVREVRYA